MENLINEPENTQEKNLNVEEQSIVNQEVENTPEFKNSVVEETTEITENVKDLIDENESIKENAEIPLTEFEKEEAVEIKIENVIEVDEESVINDEIIDNVAKVEVSDEIIENSIDVNEEKTEKIENIDIADKLEIIETSDHALITEDLDHDEIAEVINATELEDKFSRLSKGELIEMLNVLVYDENISSIKTKVAIIKVAFLKIIREEKHQAYLKFIEEGGVKEEFVAAEDEYEVQFKAAFDIYRERKNKFNDEQEKQKLDNLSQKQQIIEELKILINSEETLKKTYDDFKLLQGKWKEIGQVPRTENNNLWQNYHFLVEKFFDKVKINKELKDLDLKRNMEAKMIICEKAEELILEPSIIISFKKLQEYHDEWKETGPVPQDKKDEIWERFKNASDQINQRRHEFYEIQHQQQESNLIAKNALCDKAEQIVSVECNSVKEWQDASNQITELIKIWKTIGHAPKKQNDEVWARFKTYLDTFYAVKTEHFGKVKDEQSNNLNLKIDICLQAESIKDRTDWKNATMELLNLQKQWKEIGQVPRRSQDKIWKRFRSACDEFFTKKEAFFSTINENEDINLKKKLELIEKVKSFELSDNRNDNLQKLKDLQREWSEVGHIPIKDKDRIYNEFRTLISSFFEKLRVDTAEASAMNFRNKLDGFKENGNEKQAIYKEKSFIVGKISKVREDINLWENNIGFLAHSKQADILKKEFEKKIENAKNEVVLLEAKLKIIQNS